jgi:hypothetical protein
MVARVTGPGGISPLPCRPTVAVAHGWLHGGCTTLRRRLSDQSAHACGGLCGRLQSTPWTGGNTDYEIEIAPTAHPSRATPAHQGHPSLVTSRQGVSPLESSKGHPVTTGSPPGVTPLPRSERGLGDPGDPSCTKVLRKSPVIPCTTRRSSDTRGHRHPRPRSAGRAARRDGQATEFTR